MKLSIWKKPELNKFKPVEVLITIESLQEAKHFRDFLLSCSGYANEREAFQKYMKKEFDIEY